MSQLPGVDFLNGTPPLMNPEPSPKLTESILKRTVSVADKGKLLCLAYDSNPDESVSGTLKI